VAHDDPEWCPNCGSPIDVGGWVIDVGAPKSGAVLAGDGSCLECGMPFATATDLETAG